MPDRCDGDDAVVGLELTSFCIACQRSLTCYSQYGLLIFAHVPPTEHDFFVLLTGNGQLVLSVSVHWSFCD